MRCKQIKCKEKFSRSIVSVGNFFHLMFLKYLLTSYFRTARRNLSKNQNLSQRLTANLLKLWLLTLSRIWFSTLRRMVFSTFKYCWHFLQFHLSASYRIYCNTVMHSYAVKQLNFKLYISLFRMAIQHDINWVDLMKKWYKLSLKAY